MARARILVVEDSPMQAQEIRHSLLGIGYDVECVREGVQAIKAISTESFDLVLLDGILPDIHGIEVCRWMKANTRTKGIPIIMLTVQDSMDQKIISLESGADDYIVKPFNPIELSTKIFSSLRLKSVYDDLKKENQKLENLLCEIGSVAITDHLTGLYNRLHFDAVILREFKQALRYGTPLSCMMVDIDHFKKINDCHGHQLGDRVLIEVAGLFRAAMREVDIVARWGGEEFIALMPHTDEHGALIPAERLRHACLKYNFSISDPVTVSVGVASIPHEKIADEESFIKAADYALYEAKNNGRNRVERYMLQHCEDLPGQGVPADVPTLSD